MCVLKISENIVGLSNLRMILSTGSPLKSHSFHYVYEKIKEDIHLGSITGGTDIIGLFAACIPTLPVYPGEIQGKALGMAVDVFDHNGNSADVGDLVCTKAFPTMPLFFWNDPENILYKKAYFNSSFKGTLEYIVFH